MILPEIEHLIIKYLNKSANSTDLDILNDWIQNPENKYIFKDFVKTHYAIAAGMNNPDKELIRERLRKEMRKDKNIFYRYRLQSVLKYAAMAILFMGIGYFFQHGFFNNNTTDQNIAMLDAITLKMDNGAVEIISEDINSNILDENGKIIGEHKGNQLVYINNQSLKKLKYNELSVPYGKRFNVVLSDGTNIVLNSGSSIKYPIKFLKGKERQVFLKGEAYFDVAHDPDHPFLVNADKIIINVLGTKFNVTNYGEDNKTEAVLIDGSVSLASSQNKILLKPGFKASYDKTFKNITTTEVNTNEYTAWMNGNLIFRNISFKNIIKKLERAYNVTIINNNKTLNAENFNATIEFDRESIEEVLGYFNKIYKIEYRILENKIIIN